MKGHFGRTRARGPAGLVRPRGRIRAVIICPPRTSIGRGYTTCPNLAPVADPAVAGLLLQGIPALLGREEHLLVVLGNIEGPMDLFDSAPDPPLATWVRAESVRATCTLLREGMRAMGARTESRRLDPRGLVPVATECVFVSLADIRLPGWLRGAFPPAMRDLRSGPELVQWFMDEAVPEALASAAAASRAELQQKCPLLPSQASARQIRLRYALRRAAGAFVHAYAEASGASLVRTSFLAPQPGDDLEVDASAQRRSLLEHQVPPAIAAPVDLRWAALAAIELPAPEGFRGAMARLVAEELAALPTLAGNPGGRRVSMVVTDCGLHVEDLAFLTEPADVRIVVAGNGTVHIAVSRVSGDVPAWMRIVARGTPLATARAPLGLPEWRRAARRAQLRAPSVPAPRDAIQALRDVRAALLTAYGPTRIRGADPWLSDVTGASVETRAPGGALPVEGPTDAVRLFEALARAPDNALACLAGAPPPRTSRERLEVVEQLVECAVGAAGVRAGRAAFTASGRGWRRGR